MKKLLLATSLLLAACGAPVDDEPVDATHQAASTDAWQGLYALRASGTSYVLNPLGSAKVSCALTALSPANPQPECTFARVNFATLPLSAARRQQVIDRVALEPVEESRVSVIVKGRFVSSRALPNYREFQVLAAYMAPSLRTHGAATWYVGGAASGGYYPLRTINSDLTGLTGLTLPTRFTWVGPVAERPSSYPVDSVVALARIYSVGTPGSFGPFAADVDQRFVRVTN
jgi:hypothetical protein